MQDFHLEWSIFAVLYCFYLSNSIFSVQQKKKKKEI